MNIKEWEELELTRNNTDIQEQQVEKNSDIVKNRIHIVYVMVWTQVCGGSKVILEHANRLVDRGQDVTIVTYGEYPQWFALNDKVNFIQVPEGEDIKKYIPQCDLIVATSWKCIYETVVSNIAPVVFFEQGGSHLFEEQNISKMKLDIIKQRIRMVPFIFTVSSYAKEKMMEIYGKDSEVICISVEPKVFYPREKNNNSNNIELSIVGSEDFKFKNIEEILVAYRILQQKYPNIYLNWITQTQPTKNPEKAIVNPPQIEIGNVLRKSDIYICNSEYESFGLPTLEAMTCGAAVITTNTGGMSDFVIENENALIVKKHDTLDLVQKIESLINDRELRERLSKNGMETAKKFSWDSCIDKLICYYQEISKYKIKKSQN